MIPGPRRRAVYGMQYGVLQGVQSNPRIMRGAPVTIPGMFDVPLMTSRRDAVILQQQGRMAVTPRDSTGTVVRQVPMAGLESQGLARTLGSLGGCTLDGSSLGDDAADRREMARAKECLRPGEIRTGPGRCGVDPRDRVNPYAAAPTTNAIPISVTVDGIDFGSPKVLLIGAAAVAALLYFRRKK